MEVITPDQRLVRFLQGHRCTRDHDHSGPCRLATAAGEHSVSYGRFLAKYVMKVVSKNDLIAAVTRNTTRDDLSAEGASRAAGSTEPASSATLGDMSQSVKDLSEKGRRLNQCVDCSTSPRDGPPKSTGGDRPLEN